MNERVGYVKELTRYPIKSMAGVPVESTMLGWHGLHGDRRFAFRRLNANGGGFPWLTASRLPEMILYTPHGQLEKAEEPTPTHVRTPDGADFAIGTTELDALIGEKFGSPVELMNLKHGIFDDAPISVITYATIAAICAEAGTQVDTRRFRGNIVISSDSSDPFHEDEWIGGRLVFGDDDTGPAISIATPDPRCMMINLDPDTAKQDPAMMKTAVRLNENNAGVYCTVARTGQISVGQPVRFLRG